MPARLVREGILTSERVDALSDAAEVFYRRLMSVVDDFGLYYGNPKLIRAACYPLRLDRVSDADVLAYIAECRAAGLVATPNVSGRPLIVILRFAQQERAKASKYLPGETPEQIKRFADAQQESAECAASARHPLTDANGLPATAHLDGDGDGFGVEDVSGVVVGVGDGGAGGLAIDGAAKPQRSPNGSRIPDDFPDGDAMQWARTERPTLDLALLREKFRDYWVGVPGQRGRKADWPATWRNFVRSEFARSPPARAAPMNANARTAAGFGTSRHPTEDAIDVVAAERKPAPIRLG